MARMKQVWEDEHLLDDWQPTDQELEQMYQEWKWRELTEQGLRTA